VGLADFTGIEQRLGQLDPLLDGFAFLEFAPQRGEGPSPGFE
jgi:hypothetical protein